MSDDFWKMKHVYAQMNGTASSDKQQTLRSPVQPPKIVVSVPEDKAEHIRILERLLYDAWGIICDQSLTGETRMRAFTSLDRKMRELDILPRIPAPISKSKKK